ncbi:MAG: metal-sensing transcriptional repressor [Planctomycetota bacterium]
MNHVKCHGLHLDSGTRENTQRRLLTIKGHVEGILKMLQDEQVYCVDVLKQIKAVNGALDKVGGGDTDEIVDELMEVLKYR